MTPIRELDSRTIGTGKRGPLTEKLQKAFFDFVNGQVGQIPRLARAGCGMSVENGPLPVESFGAFPFAPHPMETSGGERAPSGKIIWSLPVPPAPPNCHG